MSKYTKHFSTKQTPQQEQAKPEQVKNSAGGYVFEAGDWTRLDRFLVLGVPTPTFYASERKLTRENAECVLRCCEADPMRTVNRIVEVSDKGLAPKNDEAIFALALACSHPKAKHFALAAVNKVCRIGTHLFQFAEAVQSMRGWGRGLRQAVANWYLAKEPEQLAHQVTKYQQRNGWSHRDLLRLSHAKPDNDQHKTVFRWAVGKADETDALYQDQDFLKAIVGFEKAKVATDKKTICSLIRDYQLPRECIPTQFLNEPSVWEALLEKMPLTAMIRNLAKMTAIGLLTPLSSAMNTVTGRLADSAYLRNSRVHPITCLGALGVYQQGHGEKGKLTWSPVGQVCDALDSAFYAAFYNIEPTNKRWLLALDVSGSMEMGLIAGMPGITPRVGTGAMAMVTARSEPQHHLVAFTSNGMMSRRSQHTGYPAGLSTLTISPRQRLDDVCKAMRALPMGGTDCALPMIYAMEKKIPVDVFVVYTDNETWAGNIHPFQALKEYRQKMGIPAKMIVVAFTATKFTIADPSDDKSLDICGFSSDAPAVMANFVRG